MRTGEEDDGTPRRRVRNPERTRQAIVDAVLSAVEEGEYAPTARSIAERAGISERSIFVHFHDLPDIRLAAAHQQARRVRAVTAPVPPEWTLEQRLDAVLEQRKQVYSLQARIRVVALMHVKQSGVLGGIMTEMDDEFRSQLAGVFAPELENTPEEDAGELLDILESVLGWAFRHHLSERRERDTGHASRAIRRTALAVLREPATHS